MAGRQPSYALVPMVPPCPVRPPECCRTWRSLPFAPRAFARFGSNPRLSTDFAARRGCRSRAEVVRKESWTTAAADAKRTFLPATSVQRTPLATSPRTTASCWRRSRRVNRFENTLCGFVRQITRAALWKLRAAGRTLSDNLVIGVPGTRVSAFSLLSAGANDFAHRNNTGGVAIDALNTVETSLLRDRFDERQCLRSSSCRLNRLVLR